MALQWPVVEVSRFAVIGWGSLLWDLENLAPSVEGGWRIGAGPRLPLEFSRISPKRKMGLAVCLDPEHGTACPTHWIGSHRGTIDAVVDDLARRERAVPGQIGAVCLESGLARGRLDPVVRLVGDWCGTHGLRGAVWTDLNSNFAEHRGPFSVPAAIAYLESLTAESRDEAVRYIENAPPETDTALRRALGRRDWWRREAARVAALDRAPATRNRGLRPR